MDGYLKCNNLQCRAQVEKKAIITTCSHVFCLDCGNKHFSKALVCPACDSTLTQPDDIVVRDLHPTEDFKASCLAGLSPEIVIDIASRALSFWTYQQSQESAIMAMMVKVIP